MKQVIHDLYSGDEIETLDLQWDQDWKPTEGKKPMEALFRFAGKRTGNWNELCDAITDLMLVNGRKINGAIFGARLNGEWIYLSQIADGLVASMIRQWEMVA